MWNHLAGAAAIWSVTAAIAQAPPQLWVQQFGTTEQDRSAGAASDGSGGLYVIGWTSGVLSGFGPASFLGRFDAQGEPIRIRQVGNGNTEGALAVASDGTGGAYVGGATGGGFGGPNAGFADAFVVRYDSNGAQLWVRQLGTSNTDETHGLALDSAGGVFVGGISLGSLGGNDPLDRVFLARYDAAGNQIWLRQFGIAGIVAVAALAPDGAGGFFFCGMTPLDIARPNPNFPMRDVVLARFDSAGERLWIRQFGSDFGDTAYALAPDGAGGVYVGGDTGGNLGGPSAGQNDAFLVRYDGGGTQLWARQFGTPGYDIMTALAPDGAGGIFVAGDNTVQAVVNDAFIGRYDSAGTRLWIRALGTPGIDLAAGLAPDAAGGVYLAGSTQGSLGGPNQGDYDIFLARFGGSCYPNCDGSTAPSALNVGDFVCFMRFFAAADPYANCDHSTLPPVLNVADFVCFQERFAAGCP